MWFENVLNILTTTDPTTTDPAIIIPITCEYIANNITTQWNITDLSVVKQTVIYQDLVIKATYKYTGIYTDPNTQQVYTSIIIGDITLPEPTTDADFIPYENLTEEIVLSWVIPQINIDNLNTYIKNDITNQVLHPEIS